MKTVLVTHNEENQRIDKFLKKYLNSAPSSFIYKLFRKKDVKVNGHWVKENYIIKEGEELSIYITDAQYDEFNKVEELEKKELKYQIIFEDENILIVNKPRGVLVHGDEFEKRHTLTNDVLNYLYFKGEYDPKTNKGFIPGPAHRLDRNTSGIVVFGKNLPTLQLLQDLFKDKAELEKKYLALVKGTITKDMEIDYPLKKDSETGLVSVCPLSKGGKSALTLVHPKKNYKDFTLVECTLVTGRTHQIRVHLSKVGFPIVGDSKYGDFKLNKEFKEKFHFENQFLHAYSLKFKNIPGVLGYLSNKTFISSLIDKEKDILELL